MITIRRAWHRLRALVRRDALERELAEELDFHLEMQTRKHIAAGLAPADARRLARREFGNRELAKEDARDVRGVRAVEEIVQDVRYAARLLKRSPGFAFVSIVAIGLAIGINAGFFTLVDAFVWRPIPVARPQRLVKGALKYAQRGSSILWSYPQVQTLAQYATTLSDVIPEGRCANVAFRASTMATAIATAPLCVSGNYFAALGGTPQIGRPLVDADDRAGAQPAIVISDAFWERAYGRAADVVGHDVIVNGTHATIAGVMPRSFVGLEPIVPDFWMTIALASHIGATPGRLDDPANRFIDLRARLRPNVSRPQAEAELSGLVAEPAVSTSHTERPRVVGVILTPNDSVLPATWQTMLLLAPALMVVALVLVIACANLTTLTLSRALARQREIAVRVSMGASRGRVVRQLLTESFMVAVLGAILGFALSRVTILALSRAYFAVVPARFGTIAFDLTPSWRVLAYTVGLAGLAVMSFGLAPALQVTSQSLTASLKGDDAALGNRLRRSRLRDLLIATQVAGSLVLLVASSTLVASMRSFGTQAPGLDTRNVIVASLGLSAAGRVSPKLAASRAVFAERVRGIRGVTGTARALFAPYTSWYPLLVVRPLGSDEYRYRQYNIVTAEYFTVIGQRLRAGRAFDTADSASNADVAIVSMAAARTLWPASAAVGQLLRVARSRDEPDRSVRIVGVVADAHSGNLWDEDEGGYVYLPATAKDFAEREMPVLVRADTPSVVTRAIQDVARQVDANAPLDVAPAQSARELMLTPIEYGTWITSAVGAFGLLLSLVGLYGIVSFAIVQRRRDLAVHVALGALPRDILALVLSRELRLVAIGLAIGLVLSSGEVRLIAAWLVPLVSLGPLAFAVLALALFAVALLACVVPALSALRIAPMTLLRQD